MKYFLWNPLASKRTIFHKKLCITLGYLSFWRCFGEVFKNIGSLVVSFIIFFIGMMHKGFKVALNRFQAVNLISLRTHVQEIRIWPSFIWLETLPFWLPAWMSAILILSWQTCNRIPVLTMVQQHLKSAASDKLQWSGYLPYKLKLFLMCLFIFLYKCKQSSR